MWILVDLIIIGIIALCTFLGYRQGLIKAAIKIFTFLIAIIIALTLYKPVSNTIINHTNIDENIQNKIVEKILPEGIEPNQEVEIELNDTIPNSIINKTHNTVNKVANSITVKIIETSALLIIFILSKIILKFITVIADWIAKIPVIKQFNKLRRSYLWGNKRHSDDIFVFCYFILYSTFNSRKHSSFSNKSITNRKNYV